jgi:hypothetical protein
MLNYLCGAMPGFASFSSTGSCQLAHQNRTQQHQEEQGANLVRSVGCVENLEEKENPGH